MLVAATIGADLYFSTGDEGAHFLNFSRAHNPVRARALDFPYCLARSLSLLLRDHHRRVVCRSHFSWPGALAALGCLCVVTTSNFPPLVRVENFHQPAESHRYKTAALSFIFRSHSCCVEFGRWSPCALFLFFLKLNSSSSRRPLMDCRLPPGEKHSIKSKFVPASSEYILEEKERGDRFGLRSPPKTVIA